MLEPLKGMVPMKSGQFDEASPLNDQRAPWLGVALQKHVKMRRMELRQTGKSVREIEAGSLWKFTQSEALQVMKEGLKHYGQSGWEARYTSSSTGKRAEMQP